MSKKILPSFCAISVLIVDDDKELRETLREVLSDEAAEVEIASNGKEAIEELRKRSYDVVVTDIKMPEMDGIQLLDKIKKLSPQTYVIIITGYASLETAIEAIRKGAYDYITKPFHLEEIKIAIKRVSEKIKISKENKLLIENLKEAYKELELLNKTQESLNNRLSAITKITEDQKKFNESFSVDYFLPSKPLHLKEESSNEYILLELEKLGELLDKGYLTQEEFQKCKKVLLAKL